MCLKLGTSIDYSISDEGVLLMHIDSGHFLQEASKQDDLELLLYEKLDK